MSECDRRLAAEWEDIKPRDLFEEYGFDAWPEDGNLRTWSAIMSGLEGSIWEDAKLRLTLTFSDRYPFDPPKVLIKNWKVKECTIFHPNIGIEGGNICLDVLNGSAWTPESNIISALMAVQALLDNANPDSPLNRGAASRYREREETVKRHGLNSEQDRNCEYTKQVRGYAEATKQQYHDEEEEDQ
jgi:ubiquitin-conjugating enzyme E2 C